MKTGRHCPICGCYRQELLHEMTFARSNLAILPDQYRIVKCDNCGFVYDDVDVGAEVFAKYYAASGKYVQKGIGGSGDISKVDRTRYDGIIKFIESAISRKDVSIADVGCGKGGLLRVFKEHGYCDVHGFEPSPACVAIMKAEYGIPATCASISNIGKANQRFTVVVVSNVFEHLFTVHDAIDAVSSILREDGIVYVDVPDGSRYHECFYAPYYSFDMEHINHFDVSSMKFLWSQHGFKCLKSEETIGTPVPGRHIPMCRFLFKKAGKSKVRIGGNLMHGVSKFIAKSRIAEDRLARRMTLERSPCYWGCGAYAKWLLSRSASSALGQPSVIVDAGAGPYSSESINGIPIVAPSALNQSVDFTKTMIITSVLYERQIFSGLKKLGWKGPIFSGSTGSRKVL